MNELKKKRKAVEVEAKSLNKANEILSKELKISKFEFSEIEKRYNQGTIRNFFHSILCTHLNAFHTLVFGF